MPTPFPCQRRRVAAARLAGLLAGTVSAPVAAAQVTPTAAAADAPVLRVEDLSTAGVARLDRAHTVVLLVAGVLQEHGPYMPVGSDGVRNLALADTLTRRITARAAPDGRPWRVLRFPFLPLGAQSFDESVGSPDRPAGSFPVRVATERAVFMDLADRLGAQGFRRVFVVHGHGAPMHNRALDDAGDYFRDTYGDRAGAGRTRAGAFMVHLLGRVGCQPDFGAAPPPDSVLSPAARAENVDSPHADATELSRVLLLRPDLVDPAYATAPNIGAANPAAWQAAARRPDWPGYVGAPRHASAALGAWNWQREVAGCVAIAERLLVGADERTLPRYADRMLAIPPVRALEAEIARGRPCRPSGRSAGSARTPRATRQPPRNQRARRPARVRAARRATSRGGVEQR